MTPMDPAALGIFASRIASVCEEMGAVLTRAAFSPNIRDRLDLSCAVFDAEGALCAQAAHIPVHLGSMAYAMQGLVAGREWSPGDVMILNDPFRGGTHLPDVTVIQPVFHAGERVGFVANRAHHADIGSETPGSMPVAQRLEEEGMVIPPTLLARGGVLDTEVLEGIVGRTRTQRVARGDISAQISADRTGADRLEALVARSGPEGWRAGLAQLDAYAERLARQALSAIPDGRYVFSDHMDDDGFGHADLPIRVAVTVEGSDVDLDFEGTAGQVAGNINCPLPVTAAACIYVFRCLMPAHTPASAGAFRPIRIRAPAGSLVDARYPAAVAAGNVETSMRIVDVVMGALAQAVPERMAAASQGSMNNVAIGAHPGAGTAAWAYYETLGGGTGAHPAGPGLDAVHSHMTNTRNTPVETLEIHHPMRVTRYGIRRGSGGHGRHRGGDGLVRDYRFLEPATVSVLTERRTRAPWGLEGGEAGTTGVNRLDGEAMPGKFTREVRAGQVLSIETPGGGAWGRPGIEEGKGTPD